LKKGKWGLSVDTANVYERVWDEYGEENDARLRELQKEYLKEFFPIAKRLGIKTVLDAGCGNGNALILLAEHGFKVTGLDLNVKQALEAKQKNPVLKDVKIVKGNIEKIPFPDNSFDAVILSGVLHHSRKELTVPEIKRVAKDFIYLGLYGKRGRSFDLTEKVLRSVLSKVPQNVNLFLLNLFGVDKFTKALFCDHVYVPIVERYDEKKVQRLFGENYYFLFSRIRHYLRCSLIFKKAFLGLEFEKKNERA